MRPRKRKWDESSQESGEDMNVETAPAAIPLVRSDAEQDDPYVSAVKDTVKSLVKVALKTADYKDMVGIVSKLAENFQDVIACFALEMTEKFTILSLPLIDRSCPRRESPIWQSYYCTTANIINAVKDDRSTLVDMEWYILRVVTYIIDKQNVDLYHVAVDVMSTMALIHITEPMWEVIYDLCNIYLNSDHPRAIHFTKFIEVLHPCLVTDTDCFVEEPARLQAFIDVCQVTLDDDEEEESNLVYAAKLMESLILQCGHLHIKEAVPKMMRIVVQRLMNPQGPEMDELRQMLIMVVFAAIYICKEVTISVLREIMEIQNPLDYFCCELLSVHKELTGVHDRKLPLILICEFLSMPAEQRPAVINDDPGKVIKMSISLFRGLQRVVQSREHKRNVDRGIEMEFDESADAELNIDLRGLSVMELIDDDRSGETTVYDYFDALANEKKQGGSANDDDDDEHEPSDEKGSCYSDDGGCPELYRTMFDLVDVGGVFVRFKKTMEALERSDRELMCRMLMGLTSKEMQSLRILLKLCERYERTGH